MRGGLVGLDILGRIAQCPLCGEVGEGSDFAFDRGLPSFPHPRKSVRVASRRRACPLRSARDASQVDFGMHSGFQLTDVHFVRLLSHGFNVG